MQQAASITFYHHCPVCHHDLLNSPSIHFWERNPPAPVPCSQTQQATCICCCPQWCTLREILAVYQLNFPFHKAKHICLVTTEHPSVSSSQMFPTLHFMTAQASPRPPFRGCFSVWSTYCHLSGVSPQLAHFNFRYHLQCELKF